MVTSIFAGLAMLVRNATLNFNRPSDYRRRRPPQPGVVATPLAHPKDIVTLRARTHGRVGAPRSSRAAPD